MICSVFCVLYLKFKLDMLPKEVIDKKDEIVEYLGKLELNINKIRDTELMLTAFIHKSFSKDFKQNVPNNERLEFLWDAVLGALVAELLFKDFENLEESLLTLYKINLVKEETLAKVARNIDLWNVIFLWRWEEKTWGRDKDTILADSLEALVGYIWLDLGYDEAKKFVKKFIYSMIDEIKNQPVKPYKNLLQEKVQKLYKIVPEYKDYEWEKDEKWNVIVYKSEVYVLGEKKWEGFGPNKKKAQEEAAKMAYENWK